MGTVLLVIAAVVFCALVGLGVGFLLGVLFGTDWDDDK